MSAKKNRIPQEAKWNENKAIAKEREQLKYINKLLICFSRFDGVFSGYVGLVVESKRISCNFVGKRPGALREPNNIMNKCFVLFRISLPY